ncbi:MAG: hypothetical protein HC767_05530 [Akkermansiaceae bacterium]|nr:hypothetical protein [Akkermansiaceae bacterium]
MKRVLMARHKQTPRTMGDDGRHYAAFRFGTLEELMEAVTWTQLGHHAKAVGVLNINGFYDHLLTFLDTCESEVLHLT